MSKPTLRDFLVRGEIKNFFFIIPDYRDWGSLSRRQPYTRRRPDLAGPRHNWISPLPVTCRGFAYQGAIDVPVSADLQIGIRGIDPP